MDLLTLSTGGKRPYGGSLSVTRGGDVNGIVLGLLRHEVGDVVGGGVVPWASNSTFTCRRTGFCVLRAFQVIE
jgi:hypothetical protein